MLKSAWQNGETTYGAWCTLGSTFAAELLALEGFHYVCIDQQHGLLGYESLVPMLQAVTRTNTAAITRVPTADSAWIAKSLDAGAHGVIVPMVSTASEAAQIAAACRYAPLGTRSFGPVRASTIFGEDPDEINEKVTCIVMIETPQGVENADEIASVPGIDAIYEGPADLSIALGLKPTLEIVPGEQGDAIARIAEACRHHGIAVGIHCANGTQAFERVKSGFQMVTVATDSRLVRTGAKAELDRAGYVSESTSSRGVGVYQ
jgi:4-hydroxy-2-oxoheptanedioate aldolase